MQQPSERIAGSYIYVFQSDRASRRLNSVELDHVLIAVADLAPAGLEIEERYGLTSIEGGHHPAWGTANRIVPLGDSYLELVAVVDGAKAAQSVFGRWIASAVSTTPRPLGWVVRTSQLDEIARRLDLAIHPGSRTTPHGERLHWRTAGLDQAAAQPSLPFFIEWGRGTELPGQTAVRHRAGAAAIARLALAGDPDLLSVWLGDNQLPIEVHAGKPAVTAIVLSSDAGEIVVRS
jgi:glyoxalase-like protein